MCRGGVCVEGVYNPSLNAGIHASPVNRMTDRCKNITSPQLRLRAVTSSIQDLVLISSGGH